MTDTHTPERPDEDASESEDLAFAEQIARPLRTPAWLGVTFEARVMSAVQTEARARVDAKQKKRESFFGWLLRPQVLRLSPLYGLAMSLLLFGVALMAGLAIRGAGKTGALAKADTVHIVRFVLIDPQAQAVSLVGDFNGWKKDVTPLVTAGRNGAWTISIPLQSGRHEYAFIVQGADGQRWVADPFADMVRDEFDTESSVIMVGNVSNSVTRRTAS